MFHNENSTNSVDLLDLYEDGIARDKLRKIELRQDAMMLLRVKQKYDIISRHFAKFKPRHKKSLLPIIKLNNGKNLLTQSPLNMGNFPEVYEINLEDLSNCSIIFFSRLPNLMKLSVRFSNISLISENEFLAEERYPSLIELHLHCNNLDSSIFDLVKHLKGLKKLNLMGNFITEDIPDDIDRLQNLEELDLSYNKIKSFYVNLDLLQNFENNHDEFLIAENEKNSYEELNENHYDTVKNKFDRLQKYFKTNIQGFFHRISRLPKLKTLNLSHNKIHFFDIDPNYIEKENGFAKLENFNMSSNLIEDEISILFVIKIPNLQNLDITDNPITKNKEKFTNIDYEIFKNKNILLINNSESKKKQSKFNINDIMNYPPKPYLVKKFNLKMKQKKDLIVLPQPEEETEEKGTTENESVAPVEVNNEEDIIPLDVDPVLLTKLDMVGKKKKKVNTNLFNK